MVRFRRIVLLAVRSGEGLFSERTAAAQAWRPELVFLPLSGRSPAPIKTALVPKLTYTIVIALDRPDL
jgi:hypothetical protein